MDWLILVTSEPERPSLLRDADSVSSTGQTRFTGLVAAGIFTSMVAALGGAFSFDTYIGERQLDLGGLLSGVGFLSGIGISIYALSTRPERSWYDGRAAAESIKTLSWQYSVGGGIFSLGHPNNPDQLYLERLRDIVKSMRSIELATSVRGDQITPAMRALRSKALRHRRSEYLTKRIDDQTDWYSKKARHNASRVRLWIAAAIVLQVLGLIGAAAKAAGIVDLDLLGITATAVAGTSAWLQSKDHQNLAESYTVTARELAVVRSRVNNLGESPSEEDWAAYVEEAEEAISREHTLWLARRGTRMG